MQSLLHLTVFLCLALQVSAECTCEPETELGEDKNKALGYKIAAICSILIASAIGVSLPILGKKIPALSPESNVFFLVKSLAAGVILATGFIHILPDAFENLSSPCLAESPWGEFPFAGFIAMVSAIMTMMIDACATSYFARSRLEKTRSAGSGGDEEKQAEHGGRLQVHTHGHSHGSGSADDDSKSLDLIRHRVITQVLELGIVVHSVIIGISMGASQSPETIKPLVAALTFHQLFEGMGLGGCISQANFGRWTIVSMGLYFCLTTPVGIAIGMGITNVYNESSPTALIVQGCLNSASAGILIYMALVDLIAAEYFSIKKLNTFFSQNGQRRYA